MRTPNEHKEENTKAPKLITHVYCWSAKFGIQCIVFDGQLETEDVKSKLRKDGYRIELLDNGQYSALFMSDVKTDEEWATCVKQFLDFDANARGWEVTISIAEIGNEILL